VTAWEAMFRDQDALPAGIDRLLILGGAEAVGSLATQLLKAGTKTFVISTGSRSDSKAWCSEMGADLVLDHAGDIAAQLASAGIPHVDRVLSNAKTADNIGRVANVLRPFGHLCVVDVGPSLDVSPLVLKSASLHTEMVFSRIIQDSAPDKQGSILETVAAFVVEGRIRPIATTLLDGLTSGTMRAAHELVETGRTIGKVVIVT
jgi:NADPH2:quinone reductase